MPKAGLKIDNGQPQELIVALGDNTLSWLHHGETQELVVNGGYFVVKGESKNKGFAFYSSPIAWQVNDLAVQESQFLGRFDGNSFDGQISQLDVSSISAMHSLFLTDNKTQALVNNLALEGSLKNILYRKADELAVSVELADINSHYAQGIPSVENLSGQLVYSANKLAIDISAKNGQLDFNGLFERAIPYQSIMANSVIHFNNGILVDINHIAVSSTELTLAGTTQLDFPKDGNAAMSLHADIQDLPVHFAKYYYPRKVMGKNLVDYLEMSLTNGMVDKASVVFDGEFKNFPFEHAPGHFEVNAELVDSDFRFSRRWPVIEKLNANLNFTKNSMLISAHSGSLTGLDVTGTKVGIERLDKNQVVAVDISLEKQNPAHVRELMNQSTLAKTVGNVLNIAQINQPISGDVHIDLPVNDADSTVASGNIYFKDNQINLQSPNMLFTDVNGVLRFKNELISVDELSVTWQGLPLNITINGQQNSDAYQTDFALATDWPLALWQQKLPAPLRKYVTENLAWQGDLALRIPSAGGVNYQLDLHADLTNNALLLPKPFTKVKDDISALQINVKGDEGNSIIQANIDKNINFYGELNHQNAVIERANLVLGNEKMMLPMQGFHIAGTFDNADVVEWQPFISDILSETSHTHSSEKPSIIAEPERITVAVEQVTLLQETFNDVSITLDNLANWWQLAVNAKEMRSQVKIFPDLAVQGIDVNFDFLHLPENEENLSAISQEQEVASESSAHQVEEPEVVQIDHQFNVRAFNAIPPMKVNCQSCKLGRIDLGKVSFELAKTAEDTLLLKNFLASRKGASIKGQGQWLVQSDYSSTQLEGQLSIKDIEREMDGVGYASIIKDSGAELGFDVNWLGSLADFSVNNLNGAINTSFDDGYLADVPDKAKVFSILSLQSLVRKLTLDFRDIFSDGMFYSSIKGNATIEQGIIYTDNFVYERLRWRFIGKRKYQFS